MNGIYGQILRLVSYGLHTQLIEEQDTYYVINSLMEVFQIDEPDTMVHLADYHVTEDDLEDILNEMLDYAAAHQLIPENTVVYRDLFDTKIMNQLMKRPSEVIRGFWDDYKESPKKATDHYYKLSCDSNYIRRYRIKKDMKWKLPTEYGELDITINLSKPEKDPKAIAAAKTMKQTSYPKCLLCKENEGYAGRVNHPARQNHRIIPITMNGKSWYLQYSPYVYYNEHCIVFNSEHIPMVINKSTFQKLFDFIKLFPHYTVGSNADLPIVGGSILTHEHFQGGNYEFAMAKAGIDRAFTVPGYEDIEAGIVKWPMSVIRLSGTDSDRMIALADHILDIWKTYSDEACFVYAETDGERHNTITPIVRTKNGKLEMDLVLRNNITTEEHPLGVFHPHANLHHIKKENIGLIEVMGMAILPARLKTELNLLSDAILGDQDIRENNQIAKHAEWVEKFLLKYDIINKDNIHQILESEVGKVFLNVLLDAGVFKRDDKGQAGFDRFVGEL